MAKIKVLLSGFTNADCRKNGEEEITRCTTTLIYADNMIILSDPGVLSDQKIMIDALKKEGLGVDDISHIFITHSHLDHYRNIGMFPKAKTIEFWGIWDGGKCEPYSEHFSKDSKIIKTPGHSYDGLTMLVTTSDGVVAIAGDLWWSKKGPEKDPFALDNEILKKSREEVLVLANYIVPGHGDIFKVVK
jgi:glyoxylase-like metal-dependent hydrolase (beta-lactamase superfamily II)